MAISKIVFVVSGLGFLGLEVGVLWFGFLVLRNGQLEMPLNMLFHHIAKPAYLVSDMGNGI